jgi:hypothetical protein
VADDSLPNPLTNQISLVSHLLLPTLAIFERDREVRQFVLIIPDLVLDMALAQLAELIVSVGRAPR